MKQLPNRLIYRLLSALLALALFLPQPALAFRTEQTEQSTGLEELKEAFKTLEDPGKASQTILRLAGLGLASQRSDPPPPPVPSSLAPLSGLEEGKKSSEELRVKSEAGGLEEARIILLVGDTQWALEKHERWVRESSGRGQSLIPVRTNWDVAEGLLRSGKANEVLVYANADGLNGPIANWILRIAKEVPKARIGVFHALLDPESTPGGPGSSQDLNEIPKVLQPLVGQVKFILDWRRVDKGNFKLTLSTLIEPAAGLEEGRLKGIIDKNSLAEVRWIAKYHPNVGVRKYARSLLDGSRVKNLTKEELSNHAESLVANRLEESVKKLTISVDADLSKKWRSKTMAGLVDSTVGKQEGKFEILKVIIGWKPIGDEIDLTREPEIPESEFYPPFLRRGRPISEYSSGEARTEHTVHSIKIYWQTDASKPAAAGLEEGWISEEEANSVISALILIELGKVVQKPRGSPDAEVYMVFIGPDGYSPALREKGVVGTPRMPGKGLLGTAELYSKPPFPLSIGEFLAERDLNIKGKTHIAVSASLIKEAMKDPADLKYFLQNLPVIAGLLQRTLDKDKFSRQGPVSLWLDHSVVLPTVFSGDRFTTISVETREEAEKAGYRKDGAILLTKDDVKKAAGLEEKGLEALVARAAGPVKEIAQEGMRVALLMDPTLADLSASGLEELGSRLRALPGFPIFALSLLNPENLDRYQKGGYTVIRLVVDQPKAPPSSDTIYVKVTLPGQPVPEEVLPPLITDALAAWKEAQGRLLPKKLILDVQVYIEGARGLTADEVWKVLFSHFA